MRVKSFIHLSIFVGLEGIIVVALVSHDSWTDEIEFFAWPDGSLDFLRAKHPYCSCFFFRDMVSMFLFG